VAAGGCGLPGGMDSLCDSGLEERMSELKPCPFCNNKFAFDYERGEIRCVSCGAVAPYSPNGELANTRPIEDALLARAEQAEAIIRGMFPLWIAAMSYAEHGRAADLDRIRNYYNGRDNPLTGEQLHYLFSIEDKK